MYAMTTLFPGLITFYIDLLVEFLFIFSLIIQNTIIFIGMTNWRGCINCYLCGKLGLVKSEEEEDE
jgi:hypothetical protein